MMDEIPSVRPPAPAPRRWRPPAPHPVVYPVWVLTAALFWYTHPRGGFGVGPGDTVWVYYPRTVDYGKALLAAYWGCMAIALGVRLWRHPRLDTRRWVTASLAALIACTAVGYGSGRFLPRPGGDNLFAVGTLAGLLGVLLAVGLALSRRPRFGLVSLGLSLLAALPLACLEAPDMWGGWSDICQATAPNGRTYRVLFKGMMQARTYVLAEARRGPLFIRATVLGNAGEANYWYPVLVRPRDAGMPAPPGRGMLLTSRDGMWLVSVTCRYPGDGREVRFAYNLRERRLYHGSSLEAVSPFLLIGPTDSLDPEDVARLRAEPWPPPDPKDTREIPTGLLLERANPNPEVRRLVAELLAKPPAGAKPQGGESAAGSTTTP
jgi:hypothetical protein